MAKAGLNSMVMSLESGDSSRAIRTLEYPQYVPSSRAVLGFTSVNTESSMSPSERHTEVNSENRPIEMANGVVEISLGPFCPISSIYSSVPIVAAERDNNILMMFIVWSYTVALKVFRKRFFKM